MIIEFISFFAFIYLLWATFFVIIPFLFGAAYEGSSEDIIKKMVEFANVKKGDKFVDLGSGDGRIVIAFAKAGAIAEGYEINPFLVLYSRRKIKKENLNAKIHWKNFWKSNLKKYDIVSVFQIGYLMKKIRKKLRKRNIKILSNYWKIPNENPKKIFKGKNTLYFYEF